MVLALDSELLKAIQLRLFNSFNLETLVFSLLADLAALLEIVEAILLLDLGVHSNLVADGLGVGTEGTVLLLLDDALLVLLFLLLLNHAEELVALGLSLLGQHHFALNKLSSASPVKVD